MQCILDNKRISLYVGSHLKDIFAFYVGSHIISDNYQKKYL